MDATADVPAGGGDSARPEAHEVQLRKEAFTMALYVAICLFAALTAVADHSTGEGQTFKIVWGTTVGLALAHWLAFRVSARLVAAGRVRSHDAEAAVVDRSPWTCRSQQRCRG